MVCRGCCCLVLPAQLDRAHDQLKSCRICSSIMQRGCGTRLPHAAWHVQCTAPYSAATAVGATAPTGPTAAAAAGSTAPGAEDLFIMRELCLLVIKQSRHRLQQQILRSYYNIACNSKYGVEGAVGECAKQAPHMSPWLSGGGGGCTTILIPSIVAATRTVNALQWCGTPTILLAVNQASQ